MNSKNFDHLQFYKSYPHKVIMRPGYPARAVFKSTLMFTLFGKYILNEIGTISNYADIGGCFGFGANAMSYQINKVQGTLPKTLVFEISSDFVTIGKQLFPHINFIQSEFNEWQGDINYFDLITLFDVVEHILEPDLFLRKVSLRSKYILLKTPMETSGELRGNKPPVEQGDKHGDGHINFFTPRSYEKLLNNCNFDIIKSRLLPTIVPRGTEAILCPDNEPPLGFTALMKRPKTFLRKVVTNFPGVPFKLKRLIVGGGDHICLCKSRSYN